MVNRALVSPRLHLHLHLHVNPVNHARASRVGALVLVVDPADRAVVDPMFVTSALGLTLAESHIAVSLAQGKSVRDLAIETGRSEGTVRWHIKRIHTKLGISRQVDLVRLVLALADIPQARD